MRQLATLLTDRQRLACVRPSGSAHDQVRHLQAPARPHLLAPPAVVNYNSLVINGENGSRWQVMFGDGHQVSTVHLADYHVHADIGHRVFNLAGIQPDAIGIDLNVGASVHSWSLSGGINLIWNTQPTENLMPGVHLYKGSSMGFIKGGSPAGPDGSVSGALLLAWASTSDQDGNESSAPSTWVANGYDWSSYHWSAALKLPTPWGYNAMVSSFTSDWHPVRKERGEWWGIALEESRNMQPMGKMPVQTWHIAQWLAGKTIPGFSWLQHDRLFGNN